VALLERVAQGLGEIALALDEREQEASRANDESISRASRIVRALAADLENWLKDNGAQITGFTIKTGLLATGCAFLSSVGAPMNMAFPVLAFMIGGQPLVDAAKSVIRGRKDKAES
jgi:hypothetical protein